MSKRTIGQATMDVAEDALDWMMYQWTDTLDTYGRWLWPIALVACSLVFGALVAGAAR